MPLIIHDRAIISSKEHSGNPAGEARKEVPDTLMNAEERADMMLRLETCIITEIMEEAETAHVINGRKEGGRLEPDDIDYITRVSTNEFFFYTQEPLTLREFEALQNKIIERAKTLPIGIQFILGSFAVKTDDGRVMNVTPHISCGSRPQLSLIVKNVTSSIDVRYKVPDGVGGSDTLPELDMFKPAPLPKILVNGSNVEFQFDNIIACKTPSGVPFLTAIDVCVDHAYGMAKQRYDLLLKANPSLSEQLISHMVISNHIDLYPEYCVGRYIMHTDPCVIPDKTSASPRKLAFGHERCTTYDAKPVVLYDINTNLQNKYAYKPISASRGRIHQYEVSLPELNDTDVHNEKFVSFRTKYKDLRGDLLKTKILDDFRDRIKKTTSIEGLRALSAELEMSHEYTVLKTGQGWFTRTFGLKTSSVIAFEDMIEQQKNYLNRGLSL